MLSSYEKTLIRSRAELLWMKRNERQQNLYAASISLSSIDVPLANGQTMAYSPDLNLEIQVVWRAWDIKQEFNKQTLRDVFIEGIAQEFNQYPGIRATFIPHAIDDERAVCITTYPTQVDQTPTVSWSALKGVSAPSF